MSFKLTLGTNDSLSHLNRKGYLFEPLSSSTNRTQNSRNFYNFSFIIPINIEPHVGTFIVTDLSNLFIVSVQETLPTTLFALVVAFR